MRCVPSPFGLALLATAAVATPLSTAAERPLNVKAKTPALPAIVRNGQPGNEKTAALLGLHAALSRAPDGATHIWYATSGHVSGTVRPTATFRRHDGRLCRHIETTVTTGDATRRSEGIACRMLDGGWLLEG